MEYMLAISNKKRQNDRCIKSTFEKCAHTDVPATVGFLKSTLVCRELCAPNLSLHHSLERPHHLLRAFLFTRPNHEVWPNDGVLCCNQVVSPNLDLFVFRAAK
jgi:hypothetical protein